MKQETKELLEKFPVGTKYAYNNNLDKTVFTIEKIDSGGYIVSWIISGLKIIGSRKQLIILEKTYEQGLIRIINSPDNYEIF